jgi:hypothetical protein
LALFESRDVQPPSTAQWGNVRGVCERARCRDDLTTGLLDENTGICRAQEPNGRERKSVWTQRVRPDENGRAGTLSAWIEQKQEARQAEGDAGAILLLVINEVMRLQVIGEG